MDRGRLADGVSAIGSLIKTRRSSRELSPRGVANIGDEAEVLERSGLRRHEAG